MPRLLDGLTFRPLGADESTDPFFDLDDLVFHELTAPARRAHLRELIQPDDTLCAYDDERLVGSSLVWPATLSVPGGQLACGGVTWVGVAPTHRRRGILTTMMGSQLNRLVRAGTPLAALWASEATIYGRFGYGVATWAHSYDIRARDAGSGLRMSDRGQPVRLLDAGSATARTVLGDIYDRAGQLWAGVLSRDELWWTHGVLADPEEGRDGSQLRIAVAGDPGDGYVLYRSRQDSAAPNGAWGVLEVRELVAVSPPSAQALWNYLLSSDLVGRVKAPLRPTDDPLGRMLKNPRTAERTENDALWIRLLDLPAAMAGRSWNGSFDLVLDVEDELLGATAGRWRLSCSDGRAQCSRTDRPADLVLPTGELAAIYLGGGSLTRARDAGLVEERTQGATETLDHGARTSRAPWNIAVF